MKAPPNPAYNMHCSICSLGSRMPNGSKSSSSQMKASCRAIRELQGFSLMMTPSAAMIITIKIQVLLTTHANPMFKTAHSRLAPAKPCEPRHHLICSTDAGVVVTPHRRAYCPTPTTTTHSRPARAARGKKAHQAKVGLQDEGYG